MVDPSTTLSQVNTKSKIESQKHLKNLNLKKKNVPFQKGERALVRPRAPKYPADDVPKRLYNRKTRNPPKVRKSLSAGTILILLSGKFRGSRVVLLKVLESGLLLVTGPYSVNGVPLKRVNPAYVIATSTKIDLKEVSNDLNDQVFRRPTKEKTPKTPEQRFEKQEEQKKERVLDPNRLNLQKTVDEQVLNVIGNNAMLKNYLRAKFTLSRGQYPHLMKF